MPHSSIYISSANVSVSEGYLIVAQRTTGDTQGLPCLDPSVCSKSILPTKRDGTVKLANDIEMRMGLTIQHLPALTVYRAHMLLMTFLAILAVDFPVFPRSLAKCETFGVSLVRYYLL